VAGGSARVLAYSDLRRNCQGTMAGMLAGYLSMIVVLRMFMKGREPYTLKLAMQVILHSWTAVG
jgi:hypothetical protein